MPLAMRSYYEGEKFDDNCWSSEDEEGVHQYFYHDKKSNKKGYRYAGTRTVKTILTYPMDLEESGTEASCPTMSEQMTMEPKFIVRSRNSSKQDVTWTPIPGTPMHQMDATTTSTHVMFFCHQR
jgi:hypothetical protein